MAPRDRDRSAVATPAALRTAVGFLTRIPVGSSGAFAGLNAAAAWFGLVGLLVGGVVAGTRALADLALAPLPAATLAVLAGILVTGALHEDGLADSADALGAHVGRERRLDILRDSRVGTYGALGVAGALLLAVSLLASLAGWHAAAAALVAHTLARAALPFPSRLVPPARADGAGRLLQAGPVATALAVLTGVAVALVVAGPLPGLACLAAAALLTAGATALFARLVGGLTGDGYGLVAKAVELGALVVLAAWWG